MIIINLQKEKKLETGLKKLKSKVQKTKLVQELRDRKEFVKPSVKKRNVLSKAKHVQKNFKSNQD